MAPRPTVLLVDDDENALALSGELLEGAGYKVLRARDGREAIVLLTSTAAAPNAIVLDLGTPIMDGRDLARMVRSHGRLAATPIIFHSSSEPDAEMRRLCQAFVPKERTHELLITTVRSFARGTFPPTAE